jgi:ribose transport system substrate-binding protein
MSSVTLRRSAIVALFLFVLALGLAACGGGSSSSSSSSTTEAESEPAETEGETEPAAEEEPEEAEASGGGVAEAKEIVAPYISKPSPFPVTEKLKAVPTGDEIDYVDCGTPICALFWEILQPAAQTMGVKLERVKAGSSASTVASAFDTVITKEPAAVIVGSVSMELWSKQLKELQEKEIPVVTTGISDTEEFGIESPQASNASSELEGKLMAAYVVAEMAGEEANAVFYETPELSFTTVIAETFQAEMEHLCPGCSVRIGKVGVEELGNTAPNTVVSDLQANPETNVAVFGTAEIEAGLPTALKAAGIEVETLGSSPGPAELQYLKEGKSTAVLGFDLPVLTWTLLDQAAREIAGQELTGPQAEGISVYQFLRKEDVQYDVSKGWSGYPNFAEMFAELWGVKG